MSHIATLTIALYGLSFFVMGVFVAYRAFTSGASHIRRRFFALAVFGIIHGVFEWMTLFDLLDPEHLETKWLLAVAALSYLVLFRFALEAWVQRLWRVWVILTGFEVIWCAAAWTFSDPVMLEVFTRLALGVPAALAAAYVYVFDKTLLKQGQPVRRAALIGGAGFALYGASQLISTPGDFFPASVLNTANFEAMFGVSCFVLRVVSALVIAGATIRLLGGHALAMQQEWEVKAREFHKDLVASEAGLAKAQRIGKMGSWEWDVAADHLIWSDQIFRIFGVKPGDFDDNYAAFLELVYPDDRQLIEELVQQALEGNARYDTKHRIILPDGAIRILHGQGEVEFSPSGRPVRMAGTVQDITAQQTAEHELRKSREMLSGILTIAKEAIILADNNLNITLFSRGAERVFGYAEKEAIGMSVEKLIPERFRSTHGNFVQGFSQGSVTSIQMDSRSELAAIRKDGEEFPVTISLSKINNGGGHLYSLILRDVGPEKAARDELLSAKIAAETANQTKSAFLANMSHELRTPLNAIIGFSETISRQTHGPVGDSNYIEYADHINQSGMHLLNIINDILNLSKIESGAANLREEVVDVSKVIESCLVIVRGRAETGGVRLTGEVLNDAAPLFVDELKLKQILINLLSNAIKFTSEGGGVALRAWSSPDAGYVFQISDTGIGIALEDIPVALAPFKQVDNELNRQFDGTGLGLALTKSLVEMHSGSLDLQSELGAGTTVTVRFPAERIVRQAANAG